jgi:hypothetical protein
VSSHITDTESPFDGWFGKAYTVNAGGKCLSFLATFTLLNDLMATATVKMTAFFTHKKAIYTFF